MQWTRSKDTQGQEFNLKLFSIILNLWLLT